MSSTEGEMHIPKNGNADVFCSHCHFVVHSMAPDKLQLVHTQQYKLYCNEDK